MCMAFSLSYGFEKVITNKDDFEITLSSPKNFTSGHNSFEVSIKKDHALIKAEGLKVSFIMPEMPGMPKMTENAQLEAKDTKFLGQVSLPHGGTWQIRISFMYQGGEQRARSSIDF
ncbi:copper resistance protein [Helicobacter marmotae]|uniref:Copper resistance protein n=2 Tax=Helicobacter marmotae TaxID=152490 RepID=A0A3D8I6P7_9HELI|nr:copper resistance protein [Helicobacter marmotae]